VALLSTDVVAEGRDYPSRDSRQFFEAMLRSFSHILLTIQLGDESWYLEVLCSYLDVTSCQYMLLRPSLDEHYTFSPTFVKWRLHTSHAHIAREHEPNYCLLAPQTD